MHKIEGRVLRAGSHVVNGYSTFVFDVLVQSAESKEVAAGEIVRLSIHSNYVEGRYGLATLAVINRGDRLMVRMEAEVRKFEGFETFLSCDRLHELEVRHAE